MSSVKRIKKTHKISAPAILIALLGIFLVLIPAKSVKASGDVHFGSANYSPQANSDFQVGVYVETTDEVLIGDYSLTLTYDATKLSFVGGANPTDDGNLVVGGVAADGKQGMHMLTFHALENVGDTSISVLSAAVNNTAGEPMDIIGLPVAPVSIQVAKTRMPEYLRVNDKEVAGLTEGQTDYTFSIPYAESIVVEAPEGFQLSYEAPASPQVGRNNITVVLTQPNAESLTLTLHANMEEKAEEPPEEPTEVTVEFTLTPDSEIPSEIESEEIPSEPEPEPVSEPVEIPTGKTTREGGFPPNGQLRYEFKNTDLYFIGGCILGAIILFVLIFLIVNGESVEYEDEDEEEDDEESGFAYAEDDFLKNNSEPKKDSDKPKKDSDKPKKDREKAQNSEKAEKKSKKESEDTKMGDEILAATYKKDGQDSVGDEIVAATYKKADKEKEQAEDVADENESAAEEKARLKEERRAEKQAAKEEKEARREEKAAEKEEKARLKEGREAEKEAAREEKEARKAEKLAEKEEKEAAKEEQARIKEEQARLREEQEAQKEAEREEQARIKEERARAKEAAREEKQRAKELKRQQQLQQQQQQEPQVDQETGQLFFLPLDYSEEDVESFTNEDEEDNIVGNAELVRSEEIADFDDEIDESAVVAATLAEVGAAEAAKAAEKTEDADNGEITKTLIMNPEDLRKQLLDADSDNSVKRGTEEYEPEDMNDDEYVSLDEDEDGFIDIESIVSDRKPK